MSERLKLIDKLKNSTKFRAAYIKAKIGVLVPAQIRALRLKSIAPPMPRQKDLAHEMDTHQSRISMFESPGANVTLDTLSDIASALRCGLVVQFVPFSRMLAWENGFSQDEFNVIRLDYDTDFLEPAASARIRSSRQIITPAAQATGSPYTTTLNALNQATPGAASYAGQTKLPPGRVEWIPPRVEQPAGLVLASGG